MTMYSVNAKMDQSLWENFGTGDALQKVFLFVIFRF